MQVTLLISNDIHCKITNAYKEKKIQLSEKKAWIDQATYVISNEVCCQFYCKCL